MFYMIKTLKSELKPRPTYDEMIGMIESQGDPNRPPIEQVMTDVLPYLETISAEVSLITLIF